MASIQPQLALSVVPVVMEETTRISSPDSKLPLNGPVALDGGFLIAGSTVRSGSSSRHAAFLFAQRSATAWTRVTKLADFSSLGVDNRLSMDMSGSTAAVSAGDIAYIFELAGGVWRQTATLGKPDDALRFASDIAVSSGVVVVGGIAEGRFVGYVYEKDGSGQWVLATRLNAGLATASVDARVPQLDVDANQGAPRVAIGSPNYGTGPIQVVEDIGSVHLFQRSEDGSWRPLEGVEAVFGPEAMRRSAEHVALGDDILAFSRGSPASVNVWEDMREPAQPDWWFPWFTPPFTESSADVLMNGEALSLATSGNRYAIGEPQDEDRGVEAGSVTIYDHQFGTRGFGYNEDPYVPKVELLASNARSGLELGREVSFSGNLLAASSSNGVYVFDLTRAHQARERISEDFEDRVAQGWQPRSATWKVVSHSGFRVYRQTSTNGEALSVLGDIDWTNQSIHADIRPLAFNGTNRWVGLVARYADDANHYALRLKNTNRIEIVRRVNGVTKILGSTASSIPVNVNRRVRFEAIGTWLRVYVDGLRVLQVRDAALKHGTVGLKTFWARAQFDNVQVSQNPAVVLQYDNFNDGVLDNWQGQGQIVETGGNRVLRHSAGHNLRTITGVEYNPGYLGLWDHVIECRVRVRNYGQNGIGWFGLISRADHHEFLDRGIAVRVSGDGTMSLSKGSGALVLDTASLKLSPGKWYRLRMESIGDQHWVYVDGRHVLAGTDPDPDHTGARYGVISSNAVVEVDNFLAQFP